jgi:hypothetical protein
VAAIEHCTYDLSEGYVRPVFKLLPACTCGQSSAYCWLCVKLCITLLLLLLLLLLLRVHILHFLPGG